MGQSDIKEISVLAVLSDAALGAVEISLLTIRAELPASVEKPGACRF
jgi:hypothetical protein